MKRISVLLFLFTLSSGLLAQTEQKPPEYGWKNTLVAGFNLTQVSLNNWVKGGENSLAWTFLTTGKFQLSQEFYQWTNNVKLTYGQTKLGSKDFEKTEDELFFESIYSRNFGWKVDPYVGFMLRTQVAPGYKDEAGVRTQTSGLFDPGYLMQSAGFTYAMGETFTTRLGVAVKETFTNKFTKYGYADDPKTKPEIEKSRVQTGIESGSSLKVNIMENTMYTSQLNLFSSFSTIDVWDVRWDNTITAKVNSYINVSLNVQVVHEIAQTRRTQLKEALALGLSYTIF